MRERFNNQGFKNTARKLDQAVVLTDQARRVTWANPAFTKLCGYTLKEMRGKRPGDFLQGKDTDGEVVCSMREALENNVGFRKEVLNYHKSGRPYWAEISVTPFFNESGEIEGHVGFAIDTTKNRQELIDTESQAVSLYRALLLNEVDVDNDPFFLREKKAESQYKRC